MFFKKENKACNIDRGLNGCDSIAKIREWQEELKKLDNNNLNDIFDKYESQSLMNNPCLHKINSDIIHDILSLYAHFQLNPLKYKDLNKYLIDISKDIADYYSKGQLRQILKEKIELEKNKLGIE